MRLNLLKKQKSSIKMSGRIVSVNDNQIFIRFLNTHQYKKGQFLIVSIPNKRVTALGKVVSISDIIACGEVSNIDKDVIVINSPLNGPIISRPTIKNCHGQTCDMLVNQVV